MAAIDLTCPVGAGAVFYCHSWEVKMKPDVSFNALRANFENALAELLRTRQIEKGLPLSAAFNRVAAEWLGYELEEYNFVDGAGDHGVDFWFSHPAGFDVVQTKVRELNKNGAIVRGRFDVSGVNDLRRVRAFLLEDKGADFNNKKLKKLKEKWDFEIAGRRQNRTDEPLVVNLILLVLGDGLTPQAQREFEVFASSLEKPDFVGKVQIQFRLALYTLDTLIEARWREQNREWRDKSGRKRNFVDLTPYNNNWIGFSKDVVFYCYAIDLVRAYDDFGYQIFEPNVRAHIRKSKVNTAIEESVKRRSARHEFRLLNNGVTITCSGYSNPTQNRPSFRIREPGIVNGLQTVVALHSGYSQLSHTDKEDFEQNCFVLVRVLQKNAVSDINKVVLATNNQNPMQSRNLMSNRSEQIYFEQLFAEKGWFYERKQGAWDAFYADPSRWRTLSGKKPKHFRARSSKGRPRYKRVDNEVLAQTWLAFVGFSREATNLKKELFDDKWYEFIFLRQLPNHARYYDYNFERAQAASINQAPDVDLMLLSWLARELTRAVAPSAKANRETAIARLHLDTSSMTKEEIDVELVKDHKYTLGQVLRSSSLLFVETLGYVLYKSLDQPHGKGALLFANGIAMQLKDTFDLEAVARTIEAEEFDPTDVLAVIWNAFYYVLDSLLMGSWGESYRAASVKTRFLLSVETRKRITSELDKLDSFLRKRELARVWATGIAPGQGLYGFVASCIHSKRL